MADNFCENSENFYTIFPKNVQYAGFFSKCLFMSYAGSHQISLS